MNIIEKLKSLGYVTIPEEFYRKVGEWKSWYQGDVKGFHQYKVRNGHNTVRCRRYSLGMGKKIPEDWANLLMNEKVGITLEGKKEQEFVDRVLEENNFLVKANEMQELAFALGTVAFIPRVVGMEITEAGPTPGSAAGIDLELCNGWKTSGLWRGRRNYYRVRLFQHCYRKRRILLLSPNPPQS